MNKKFMVLCAVMVAAMALSSQADITNDVESISDSVLAASSLASSKIVLAVGAAVGLWSLPFVWRKIRGVFGR